MVLTTTRYIDDVSGDLPLTVQDRLLRYIHGPELAYALLLDGTPKYVYHTDGQGSVRAITNPSGTLQQAVRYDPYGQVRASDGSIDPNTPQLFGYVGEPWDSEPELVHLRARAYSPSLGRFLQRDTEMGDIIDPSSLNRYAYAKGDSVNRRDPSGHFTLWNGGGWGDYWSTFSYNSLYSGFGFGGFGMASMLGGPGGFGYDSWYGGFGGYSLMSGYGYPFTGMGQLIQLPWSPCDSCYAQSVIGFGGLAGGGTAWVAARTLQDRYRLQLPPRAGLFGAAGSIAGSTYPSQVICAQVTGEAYLRFSGSAYQLGPLPIPGFVPTFPGDPDYCWYPGVC